jgi:LuxR family transcriptional regulator, maltose regulon positive regulatory protein
MATAVGAARRRIIRRPRLTAMLDESTARIRMLIAPAGYGKTTLAREWLGEPERRDVWYRGGPASADVAALSAGIAEAVGEIIPDAGKRMRERVRATGHPEEDVDILAELFAEDVQEWPEDAWLAIDDYQFAMESAASERFVDLLTQATPIQLLVTSRRRPSWATARRILYGEVFEIDRRALAMEDAEARRVVDRDDPGLTTIVHSARGWPAVIGLVGLNPSIQMRDAPFPEQLYDYFAEELYTELSVDERQGLGTLSFVRSFDASLVTLLLGSNAEGVLAAGTRIGVAAESNPKEYEIHPLLAEFLQERAFPNPTSTKKAARQVGEALLRVGRWDDAVDLATRYRAPELLVSAFSLALESLVNQGRVSTVLRWLDRAASLKCQSPILDLAEAEVAFRLGEHRRAENLAMLAVDRLPSGHPLESRAHICAGQGALLASRERESIGHFEKGRKTATSVRERREALYGLYSAMSELERPEAANLLDELRKLELDTADDLLRRVAIGLIAAVRNGGIQDALAEVDANLDLLDKATDPLIKTSFLHSLSTALSLRADYERSTEVGRQLLELSERSRFDFARPFAHLDLALGHLGLRQFSRAMRDIECVEQAIPASGDLHLQANLAIVRGRLLIATGRPLEGATECSPDQFESRPPEPLLAEVLINQALAFACGGEYSEALRLSNDAEAVTAKTLVIRVLLPAVRSICGETKSDELEFASASWRAAVETGNFDSLVTAYRGHPRLLRNLHSVGGSQLGSLLRRARDSSLAREHRIALGRTLNRSTATLTRREVEVLELISTGISNKEAAQALFIVESTIKVHLRHIYAKLGVRGRTEAVAFWVKRP